LSEKTRELRNRGGMHGRKAKEILQTETSYKKTGRWGRGRKNENDRLEGKSER
jgi:phosphotransferase system HPr-like phosphotransfer protein